MALEVAATHSPKVTPVLTKQLITVLFIATEDYS